MQTKMSVTKNILHEINNLIDISGKKNRSEVDCKA